jgi:hypothetical protein
MRRELPATGCRSARTHPTGPGRSAGRPDPAERRSRIDHRCLDLERARADALQPDPGHDLGDGLRRDHLTLVIHLWDDRRLVMPTSYFMSQPFENWTRREAALLGTVELDLDWSVPVEEMREELRRILAGTVRVRALVSAADAEQLHAPR